MNGSNSGSRSLRMFVGIGSKEQDFNFDDIMSRWTSSRVSFWKALNSEVAGGSLVASRLWIDGWFQSSERKSPEDIVRMDPLLLTTTRSNPMMEEKARHNLQDWPECSEIWPTSSHSR